MHGRIFTCLTKPGEKNRREYGQHAFVHVFSSISEQIGTQSHERLGPCGNQLNGQEKSAKEMDGFVENSSIWLVLSTPLKNMKVSWDDYSQYMGK